MLSGTKVRLRAPIESDLRAFYDWINDPQLVRLNAPWRPVSLLAHVEWFQKLNRSADHAAFAICRLDNEDAVGLIQLRHIDAVHRSAELIIRIGLAEHRGRGLGTESVTLAADFAWRDLGLHRITLHVFADNAAAISCYRKAGFVEEGRLRQAAYIDGRYKDIVVMGLLCPGAANAF